VCVCVYCWCVLSSLDLPVASPLVVVSFSSAYSFKLYRYSVETNTVVRPISHHFDATTIPCAYLRCMWLRVLRSPLPTAFCSLLTRKCSFVEVPSEKLFSLSLFSLSLSSLLSSFFRECWLTGMDRYVSVVSLETVSVQAKLPLVAKDKVRTAVRRKKKGEM